MLITYQKKKKIMKRIIDWWVIDLNFVYLEIMVTRCKYMIDTNQMCSYFKILLSEVLVLHPIL